VTCNQESTSKVRIRKRIVSIPILLRGHENKYLVSQSHTSEQQSVLRSVKPTKHGFFNTGHNEA